MTEKLPRNKILQGDARKKLKELPNNSVDMAMTSPPYWGLRDYGEETKTEWEEGNCQLGLEPTPDLYVKHLMGIFNELKKVLKPTGLFFLNIGDTYSGGGTGGQKNNTERVKESDTSGFRKVDGDVPNKCMSMIPERVMMAMVNNGWILRNKIIWNKPNPMPESVKDRFSTGYEVIYMFSLNKQYHFDLYAVREPHKEISKERIKHPFNPHEDHPTVKTNKEGDMERFCNPKGKNPGDVWDITTKPFPEAHFAVYPPELCEKPIKAGCPKKVCAECGKPYEREVETPDRDYKRGNENWRKNANIGNPQRDHGDWSYKGKTKGWEPTCNCSTDKIKKGVVLDPLAGAGTTCLAARKHNRNYIGIEISQEYVEMAKNRIRKEVGGQPLDRFTDDRK